MDNVYDLGENYSNLPTTDMNSDPCDYTNEFQNAGPNMGHPDILDKLLTNPDFKAYYINRYADLINTALKCLTLIISKLFLLQKCHVR
jgi:spore coat protein CotH